jgi:7,8-dihydroneopterin aldolase/epimerase/oxygenase
VDTETIFIDGISAPACIGIHPEERAKKQTLYLDIRLNVDARKARASDDINDTINYEQLVYAIRDEIASTAFYLVEALAEHLVQWIQARHPNAKSVLIKIKKAGVFPNAESYGIIRETTF